MKLDRAFSSMWLYQFASLRAVLAVPLLLHAGLPPDKPPPRNLADASLEELMNIPITSVSKKEQKLFATAAAVFVITQEDIRRSGLATVPEILRLAPGVEVAREQENVWAITIRGFNGEYSNKLLVMVDGRSIYSDFTSGVYWDNQEMLLENIDRIEVIRGPGGAVWGANAVNGVINIITKTAPSTPGGMLLAGAGNQELGTGGVQYGGALGPNAAYRVNAKYVQRNPLESENDFVRRRFRDIDSSLRIDWNPNQKDSWLFRADLYRGDAAEAYQDLTLRRPLKTFLEGRELFSGENVFVRWQRKQSVRSQTQLLIYFDHYQRTDPELPFTLSTLNADFQHQYAFSERNELIWGIGYRFTEHTAQSTELTHLRPELDTHLFSAFVQDEFSMAGNRLHVSVGSRFDHNTFTGFEIQPTGRLLWQPNARASTWLAVSRAVRTPSLVERGVSSVTSIVDLPGQPLIRATFLGSSSFGSETVLAYEAGQRLEYGGRLSLDMAAFYNHYDRLRSTVPGGPVFSLVPIPHLELPVRVGNGISGYTFGGEISANWTVTERWKLAGSYSWLHMVIHSHLDEGSSPRHHFQVRSYFDLTRTLQFDASIFFTGRLPDPYVPAYTRGDVRLGWRPSPAVELSLGARDLFRSDHYEFYSPRAILPEQVKRDVYAKLVWRF
jgi:iron complex outermembrane receptor protein